MNYQKYKRRRDAAWEILISHKICTLPVKISEICRSEGIVIRSFSKAQEIIRTCGFAESVKENDGFAVILGGKYYIFYDDTCSKQRQRFTVAHEFGHIVNGDVGAVPTWRNREPTEADSAIETEANIIASRILAPACVLWALGVKRAEEIAALCDISLEAATWRMKRLQLLYDREAEFLRIRGRSCFLMSEKERAVYEQFLPFIKDRSRLPASDQEETE